jgi:hypothetical protein
MAVEFFSYGYDTAPGEGIGELTWQEMHPQIGSGTYGVRSPGDWKVTAVSGADRTVSIASGRGFGMGIIDRTVANDTIQLDPISSGSRWDLIACRRDPTPTKGKSEFVKINGGATAVVPGARLSGPGIHDQPLALVQVTAGQTQPTAFIDLRTWVGDGGGLIAAHDLVRSFLNQTGTRLWIDGVDWVRRSGANDVPEWVAGTVAINRGVATALTGTRGTWTTPFAGNRQPRVWSPDGITAFITGVVQYNGSDGNIITIPSPFAPTDGSTITYVGTTQASNGSASTSGGVSIALGIDGGVLKIVYQGGTLPSGSYVPLTGSWRISG